MLYVVPSVPRAAFEEGGGGVEVLLTLRRRLPPQLVPAQGEGGVFAVQRREGELLRVVVVVRPS